MNDARAIWLRFETLHAVTYFGEETAQAARELGLNGFWAGYFALRAAPLGAVGAGVVEASFCNFAPSFVARWVPSIWTTTSPEACIIARATAAAATLTRVYPAIEALAELANPLLAQVVEASSGAGRVLFAANRDVQLPDEPVAALWQLCTTLREHRGDGHVAALTAAGLHGLDTHVMIAAEHGSDPIDLQRTRGWSEQDWQDGVTRCRQRGLLDEATQLTTQGRRMRAEVEAITDRLAIEPWLAQEPAQVGSALSLLTPAATAIAESGLIRYPNPMGLPPLRPGD